MLSREHVQLLVQAVAVVLALNYAKGYMTGEYRNLMAVALVVVVLMVADRLVADFEGADVEKECQNMLWFIPMETKTEGLWYNIMLVGVLVMCCSSVLYLMMA